MRNLTSQDFAKLWPNGPKLLVSGILTAQPAVFPKFGITTALRLCHFLAQISHECGCGHEMTESLNYSASSLLSQWPSHFTHETAAKYGRTDGHPANSVAIANLAYGGRMGNAHSSPEDPLGDGYRFIGRGLIQITGYDDYYEVGKRCGLDLIKDPELANSPLHALAVAGAYWDWRDINLSADMDDVVGVTRRINGGTIGLPERRMWLARVKKVIGL
jgi:putative chitinase